MDSDEVTMTLPGRLYLVTMGLAWGESWEVQSLDSQIPMAGKSFPFFGIGSAVVVSF
jgi:hypothetical protein